VLLMPSLLAAQIGGAGSIQGTVLDTSKSALPGATVTATNVATYFNQDLSVRRDFAISRTKLVLGIDVFNLFNNVVFGGINTNITSAAFGRVSSQVNAPRVAQIKVRVEF
jgi:hypothetical protein